MKFHAIALYFLIAGAAVQAENRAQVTVRVGALLPLTGGAAEQGNWSRQGILLAEEEINRADGPQVQIDYEDTKGDPKSAVDSFNALRSDTSLSAVLTWGSGVGLALTPL